MSLQKHLYFLLLSPLISPGKCSDDVHSHLAVQAEKNQYGTFDLRHNGDHASVPNTYVDKDINIGKDLNIFCYENVNYSNLTYWASASVKVDTESTDYEVYLSANVSEIIELANSTETDSFSKLWLWKPRQFSISPFEDICVGVVTNDKY